MKKEKEFLEKRKNRVIGRQKSKTEKELKKSLKNRNHTKEREIDLFFMQAFFCL